MPGPPPFSAADYAAMRPRRVYVRRHDTDQTVEETLDGTDTVAALLARVSPRLGIPPDGPAPRLVFAGVAFCAYPERLLFSFSTLQKDSTLVLVPREAP